MTSDQSSDNNKPTNPINSKKEVEQNPDPGIDKDHPGFPHAPSSEKQISPETRTEKEIAAVDITDGEKKLEKDK